MEHLDALVRKRWFWQWGLSDEDQAKVKNMHVEENKEQRA